MCVCIMYYMYAYMFVHIRSTITPPPEQISTFISYSKNTFTEDCLHTHEKHFTAQHTW
jgi:hypothetical protein